MVESNSVDKCIEDYEELVTKIATYALSKYNLKTPPELKRHIDLDDLTQEGFIALMKARDEYRADHESGCKFETFATHKIIGAIKSHLYTHISPIHSRYYSRVGRVDLNQDNKKKVQTSSRCKFFSELSGHSEGKDITEDIADRGEDFISRVDSQDTIDFILQKIDLLNESDACACRMRLIYHKTFADIGLALGISRQGARYRYGTAVKKLKRMLGGLDAV